jgi:GNAT superfamily N-acetyltransferase
MTISLRIADPQADYPALVEMLNLTEPEPISVAQLHEWDIPAPGKLRRRLIAVQDESVIGYSFVGRETFDPDGRYHLWLAVHPQQRRRGFGARLYDEALAFARTQDATCLAAQVQDNDPDSLRFAETRGFQIYDHAFESRLDVRAFDPAPFAGLVEAVTASGIRFTTLAAEGDTEAARRKLHRLNDELEHDTPDADEPFPDFATLNTLFDTASWFRADGQILALNGERYVGLAALGYFAHTNAMYNMITGVDKAYRGRKIAQALKLLAIQYAQASGADYIRTHNNALNAPMLAINRKLGYRPCPGVYRLLLSGPL